MTAKKSGPVNIGDMLRELEIRWNAEAARLVEITKQIEALKQIQAGHLTYIDQITRLFHNIQADFPTIKLPKLVLPLQIRFIANPNLTIGGAMEMLLIEHGPMTQRDLIDALKKGGMRISSQNPHVIVANAVKRDARNRFKRLNDGRVALRDLFSILLARRTH